MDRDQSEQRIRFKQPHVWVIEQSVERPPRHHGQRLMEPWKEVWSGTDEQAAREQFAALEIATTHSGSNLYDEMKLWHGEELLLHVWHNR